MSESWYTWFAVSRHFHRLWLVRAFRTWRVYSFHKQIMSEDLLVGCVWLANPRKIPPPPETDYQVSVPLLTVPSLQPALLTAHIPTVLTRPSRSEIAVISGAKSPKQLYWAVYKGWVTTVWSSIKRERAHAVHRGADVREYTCRLQLPHWWQSKREVS